MLIKTSKTKRVIAKEVAKRQPRSFSAPRTSQQEGDLRDWHYKKRQKENEENAELQRNKTLSQDERAIETRDILTEKYKTWRDENNIPTTATECAKLAQEVTERNERKKDG